jgi:ABC-2 type transport system ATP-binding protein
MIEVKDLKKNYGTVEALRGITFKVQRGEIVGFLGPNGAGKTTCMKILTGFISATNGTATVDGIDALENSLEVRKKLGYLPENSPLYSDMTVREFLEYITAIRNIQESARNESIAKMADICGINEVLDQEISTLSKGFRQRTGLAQALIHNPDFLILDEPTSGLDPNQIVEMRELIKRLGKERTIILSTHNLPEVMATCNRIIIIHRGSIVADGTPAEIRDKYEGKTNYFLKIQKNIEGNGIINPAHVQNIILGNQNVKSIVETASDLQDTMDFKIETKENVDIRTFLYKTCVENKWSLVEVKRDVLDLEAIFRKLTQE